MSSPCLRHLTILSFAISLLISAGAHASDARNTAHGTDTHESSLHYTYLEAGVARVDHDGADAETGPGVRGSWALHSNWHVFAGYRSYDVDGFDVTGTRAGIGFNTGLTPKMDFVARAAYEDISVSGHADASFHGHAPHAESAPSVEVGLRAAINERLEGQIGVRQVFFDESETLLLVGAEYRFTPQWALSADLDLSDAGNEVFVGLRWYF